MQTGLGPGKDTVRIRPPPPPRPPHPAVAMCKRNIQKSLFERVSMASGVSPRWLGDTQVFGSGAVGLPGVRGPGPSEPRPKKTPPAAGASFP